MINLLLALALQCGSERWAVKTASDPDIDQVDLEPRRATIANLVNTAPPKRPNGDSRYPTELKTFIVEGWITFYQSEKDRDIHAVLSDSSGNTLIIEFPDPKCVENPKLRKRIERARKKFENLMATHLNGPDADKPMHVAATGIGFWDKIHSQTGVAKNGFELHPVLDIEEI